MMSKIASTNCTSPADFVAMQREAERQLWKHLRRRNLNGHRFRRQHPIEPYVADFACLQARLIVELDGGQHVDEQSYDAQRDAFLKERGFRVLRFWDHEVMRGVESVLDAIAEALSRRTPSACGSSPCKGEREACDSSPLQGGAGSVWQLSLKGKVEVSHGGVRSCEVPLVSRDALAASPLQLVRG